MTLPDEIKKPTYKQLIEIAILFNDGKIEKEKIADMVAMTDFVLDRLLENGDVNIPSKNERDAEE